MRNADIVKIGRLGYFMIPKIKFIWRYVTDINGQWIPSILPKQSPIINDIIALESLVSEI